MDAIPPYKIIRLGFFEKLFWKLGFRFSRDPIFIPFWKQWAFKWSTPGGIDVMIPGLRIYGPAPRLPEGTFLHLTAGRWKSMRFYKGAVHSWIIARECSTKKDDA